MLKALELDSVDGLFSHLPERLRLDRVDLPEPLSEVELVQYFRELGRLNYRIPPSHSFLGAGASRRFSPAIVNQVISRPDFYTTYTPYQAEASQGTLQATYEFQTMIALLTGLDVANASLYDGATSLAEATAMAVAHTNRQNVVVAGALHPEYAQVLQTYSEAQHYEILRVATGADGRVDPAKLEQAVTPTTAAVILQQPNFYGVLEDAQPISDLAHRSGALLIACVDPISLGLLAAPGDYGAHRLPRTHGWRRLEATRGAECPASPLPGGAAGRAQGVSAGIRGPIPLGVRAAHPLSGGAGTGLHARAGCAPGASAGPVLPRAIGCPAGFRHRAQPSTRDRALPGGAGVSEPLLFELGSQDRPSPRLPAPGVKIRPIDELVPAGLRRRSSLPIASLSEPEVARHFGR